MAGDSLRQSKEHSLRQSKELFDRACRVMPGGVNSPVRSFSAVGITPIYMSAAKGAHLTDVDGNIYLDFIMAFGAIALGHQHPGVIDAICQSANTQLALGTVHRNEVEFAELISSLVPSIEQIRFVTSGTEAVLTAVRLARAFSGRDKLVKFAGNYHGHADQLLVKAGSGLLTYPSASSAGVTLASISDTLVVPYNDEQALTQLFTDRGHEIAALIVEPVAGNMNLVEANPSFLQTCRTLTAKFGALLIFDEVITGFRVTRLTAQQYYGIRPDLTILGKVIGGGMPIGAFGGRREIMEYLAPKGPVYQAGTFGAHPVCLAAGLRAVPLVSQPETLESLSALARRMSEGINQIARSRQLPVSSNCFGGLFGIHFSSNVPRSLKDVEAGDDVAFRSFFGKMLDSGVLLAPSRFEAGFVSAAHSNADIDFALECADRSLAACF